MDAEQLKSETLKIEALIHGLGGVRDKRWTRFYPIFWRNSQYKSHEEAAQQGGIYAGEICEGYSGYVDAMLCAKAVAESMEHEAAKADVMVHLLVQDKTDTRNSWVVIGDLPLNNCF